ncbi:MAG: hypothetical protein AB7F59_08080 [Bdellovibrionales bacterium]
MPKVVIERSSELAPKDLFEKIKNMLSDDKDLRKLDPNYKCQFDEGSMTGQAKGGKFDAKMSIKSVSGKTSVSLEVQLPLLLTPFKGFVEKTLGQKLDSIV